MKRLYYYMIFIIDLQVALGFKNVEAGYPCKVNIVEQFTSELFDLN
ncbi:hypothetical protein [Neobacillus sp. LXY-1]